ncbi:MAG: YfhO family protein, partial [Planctomycetales bacterium]|nr:YfhO family protein [Planctomycetales bacterium]
DPTSAQREGPRQGNQLLLAGWSRVGGYLGLPPRRALDYRQPQALRLAGARWVTPAARGDTAPLSFDKVDQPLPHARLVTHAVYSTTPAGDLAQIDVDRTALVDVPLQLPAGEPGEVQLLARSPGQLAWVTIAPSRQLLVVAESFHDGWQAFLDGRPAPLRRVNGDFIGCEVPAGRHQVELFFRPASLRKGQTFTWCGLGLMVCGLLATHRGRNRVRPQRKMPGTADEKRGSR